MSNITKKIHIGKYSYTFAAGKNFAAEQLRFTEGKTSLFEEKLNFIVTSALDTCPLRPLASQKQARTSPEVRGCW